MRKDQLKKTLKRMIDSQQRIIDSLKGDQNIQIKAIVTLHETRIELLKDLVRYLEGDRVVLSFYMEEDE